jgi:hypothetical protein
MFLPYCTATYRMRTRSLNVRLQLTVEPQNNVTRVDTHAQMCVQR